MNKQDLRSRRVGWLAAVLCAGAGSGLLGAEDVTFTPLAGGGTDTEARTGMWLRPDLGAAEAIVPLKTRVSATKESVLGGSAMKIVFEKGSTGKLGYELDEKSLKAGSAGLTLYAKASRAVKLTVCGAVADVGTDWTKIDLAWDKVGMTADKPAWQFVVVLNGPINETTTLILDRIGMESPAFDPKPKLDKVAGPDETLASKDLIYGAENLAKAAENAKAKKPFKVLALGDSVTAGAQMSRSTWGVKGAAGVPYLYFSHVARLWQEKFGYKEITGVQHGYGGKTADWALTNAVEKDIVGEAGADDVVIIEYGANDMGWAGHSPETWKADMKKLIARVKTKTANIIVLSPTSGGAIPKQAAEISKALKEIATEEKVCGVDITRRDQFRGEAFSWAGLANEYHPDFSGHIMMAELIASALTGENKNWP
ncbi:MAG TPA: SGNH/GDSL hydrolase family protein [Planctomycetota bacterium]|nr:SGNH/GDSL hydrolase family protein [Planctomycetota bacterium]